MNLSSKLDIFDHFFDLKVQNEELSIKEDSKRFDEV